MEEYEKKRWWSLFITCANYRFGTLWFIKEALLKGAMAGYDQHSTRLAHPGLSIQHHNVVGLQDTISMLVGTSKKHGMTFATTDVTKQAGPDKKTYFEVMRPVHVSPDSFFSTRETTANLERNTHKPSLSTNECGELKRLIK